MASWLATGPPVIDWCAPASVLTVCVSWKFWIAPPATRTMAMTNAIGSRIRTVVRIRSTQKLPSLSVRLRANPRTTAIATAMPTAAETKFCTARPAICTRWPMVDSPEYACQFVLVVKLTAVFHARSGLTSGEPEAEQQVVLNPLERVQEQHGDQRRTRGRSRVYAAADCSTSGSTPIRR